MKINFLPKSHLGKWAVIMMISNFIIFIIGSVLPWKSGYSGFEIIMHNPLQGVITILMLIIGIATSGLALISVFKHKERSIMVYLAIIFGLYSVLGFFGAVMTLLFS